MSIKRRFTGAATGASLLLAGATASFADPATISNDNSFLELSGFTVAQAAPAAPVAPEADQQVDPATIALMQDLQRNMQTVYEVASLVYQAAYVELTADELTAMLWESIPEAHILALGGDPSVVPPTPNDFFNALQFIYMNYVVPNDIDMDEYTATLLNTFMSKLDAHSAYHPPANYDDVQAQSAGAFGGLGISMNVDTAAGFIEVRAFADMVGGAPAENAGLEVGDHITHIDGTPVSDFDGDGITEALRGQPGSIVELTVTREGQADPLVVSVTRGVITQNPVISRTLEDGQIGYLRLSSFTGQSERAIVEAIQELEAAPNAPTSYILDLRFNPGGRVDQATGIVDRFLAAGDILSAESRRGRSQPVTAQPDDIINGKQLIILVNSTSASASEIVSGVLQHYDRATIIGETSFGKGSMQTIIPLRSTQGAGLRLTTALYLIANSHSIQNQGVVPDITVRFGAATVIDSERRNEVDMDRAIANGITPTAVDNSDHMECVINRDREDILNDLDSMYIFTNRVTNERYIDSTLLCAVEHITGVETNTRRQPDATYVAPATNTPAVPTIAAPALPRP